MPSDELLVNLDSIVMCMAMHRANRHEPDRNGQTGRTGQTGHRGQGQTESCREVGGVPGYRGVCFCTAVFVRLFLYGAGGARRRRSPAARPGTGPGRAFVVVRQKVQKFVAEKFNFPAVISTLLRS